jgi:hypothetical protein
LTESRSPSLFAPSFKVLWDIAHNPSSGFTAPALDNLNADGALKVLACERANDGPAGGDLPKAQSPAAGSPRPMLTQVRL